MVVCGCRAIRVVLWGELYYCIYCYVAVLDDSVLVQAVRLRVNCCPIGTQAQGDDATGRLKYSVMINITLSAASTPSLLAAPLACKKTSQGVAVMRVLFPSSRARQVGSK